MPPKTCSYSALEGQYVIHKTLGAGGFAKVKLATHILTGEKVAVKIMDKAALGDDLPRAKLEIEALKDLSHPNICKLYQVIETQTKFFLILEHCPGGELFDYIVEKDRLLEKEARLFFRQIISAVAYIHRKGYAHRDLKPENLLLDGDQKLKLIDFGLCAKPQSGMHQPLNTCCGSPAYAAPELINGSDYNGNKVDIWSMGVLLYALLCGVLPFDDENVSKLYRKIQKGRYYCPSWLSEGSKILLSQMLQVDPMKRISIEELKVHPWVLNDFTIPVDWDSPNEVIDYDPVCLAELAMYHKRSMKSIEFSLRRNKFDYLTSTYLLLLLKKIEGRPLNLVQHNNVLQEIKQNTCNSTLLFDSSPVVKRVSMDSLANSQLLIIGSPLKDSVDSLISNVSATSSPFSTSKTSSDKENFALPRIPSPKKSKKISSYLNTNEICAPKPAKTLGLSASLDARVNDVGSSPQMSSGKRAKSFDSPTVAPVTPQRCPPTSLASSSAKKVFGSIEKGLDRVKNLLTPKKRLYCGVDGPRKVKNLCNVSATNDKVTPDEVLESLQCALVKKGILCKQNGYTLRGKVCHGRKVQLRFELEVCQLPKHQLAVGVRRKRLEGDAWHYKKVCEEILRLALLDPSCKEHRV